MIAALAAAGTLVASAQAINAQPTTQPPWTDVQIIALQPADSTVVTSVRPAISGQFGVPVDPTSLRITLDGRDISALAYASSSEFMFTAPTDTPTGLHRVEVTGKATNGATFDRTWSFVSAPQEVAANFLTLTPMQDLATGSSFVIAGSTLPFAHVRLAATANMPVGGPLAAVDGTFVNDVWADSDGQFWVPVYINSAGPVAVRVLSIDPTTDAGASATLDVTD